jgi:hypothetical protein
VHFRLEFGEKVIAIIGITLTLSFKRSTKFCFKSSKKVILASTRVFASRICFLVDSYSSSDSSDINYAKKSSSSFVLFFCDFFALIPLSLDEAPRSSERSFMREAKNVSSSDFAGADAGKTKVLQSSCPSKAF